MFAKPRVLIVDQSADSREVLKTALERRGLEIYEASQPAQGLDLARRYHPQVIVLDLEAETVDGDACGDFAHQSEQDRTSLVVLGSAKLLSEKGILPTQGQRVSKPYHYGPLIRKIEELLA